MIDAVTRSPSGWLIPDDHTRPPSLDARVRLLECGVTWDALRTPEALALPVLHLLLTDEDDRLLVGPVLQDERSSTVHWLISPGHTATWPDRCVLRGKGAWLAIPNPANPHSKLHWLHTPATPIITAPPWLAKALAEQLAATDPTLGTP